MRRAARRASFLGLGAAAALFLFAASVPAGAAPTTSGASEPSVQVGPNPAAPGDSVTVRLAGWSSGTVTVGICGNEARRGSEDCALVGDEAVAVRGSATTAVDLTIVAPPVSCPCVVRASDAAGDLVRTTSIPLLGVPSGPELVPTGPAARQRVDVHTEIVSAGSFAHSVSRVLGGPAAKTLVVTLRNEGRYPIQNLRVVAAIGRNASSGSPLAVRPVDVVEPGAAGDHPRPGLAFGAGLWPLRRGRHRLRARCAGPVRRDDEQRPVGAGTPRAAEPARGRARPPAARARAVGDGDGPEQTNRARLWTRTRVMKPVSA